MRRIVVLGFGFGGYHAARALSEGLEGRRRVSLTVVADQEHFVFTPLLPMVASGALDVTHVALPMQELVSPQVDVVQARAEHIDREARVLRTTQGELAFDYLVIASGSQADYTSLEADSDRPLALGSPANTHALRERLGASLQALRQNPSASESPEIHAVVGGGPVGVALAAELASAIRDQHLHVGAGGYGRKARVVLLEAAGDILQGWSLPMRQAAMRRLASLGVEVRLGAGVRRVASKRLYLHESLPLDAEHTYWCAGTRPQPLLEDSGFVTDDMGRVLVKPSLRVKGHHGIFAVGESASLAEPLARTVHLASLQGQTAAQNILADLDGRSHRNFQYWSRGEYLNLGRQQAAVQLGGRMVEGRAAALMYRVFYTAMMPAALNKARLLLEWLGEGSKAPSGLALGGPPHP